MWRRKYPKRNHDPLFAIQREIESIDCQTSKRELELEDCVTDIGSDDESDDDQSNEDYGFPPLFIGPLSNEATKLREKLIAVPATPQGENRLRGLYSRRYEETAEKKLNMAKKLISRTDLDFAINDDRFKAQVDRVKETYPLECGRRGIKELVGFFAYTNEETDSGESETDESDAEMDGNEMGKNAKVDARDGRD